MPANTELEIKLAVPDHRLCAQILSDPDVQAIKIPAEHRTKLFEAFYYDTSDFALHKAGIAYRLRREGEDWIATAKSDTGSGGALFSREELNEKALSPDPAVRYFNGTRLGDRMAIVLGESNLQLLFSTKFERTTMLLKAGNASLVELAMDRGMIWGGSAGIPISEVELELKEGCIHDLLQLAGWVAEKFHLHPEPLSKYARGLSMLNPEGFIIKKRVARLDPLPLLSACIGDLFEAQSIVLREQGKQESIKALRIQIRKLRSLMNFFQPFLRLTGEEVHREKLKRWGEILGSIRDLDVLQDAWREFGDQSGNATEQIGGWAGAITERRDFLAATVLFRLGRSELTREIFELQAWLLQTQSGMEVAGAPKEGQIRKAIMSLTQELRREIGDMRGIPEIKRLHALRIRTKRLRYLLEAISFVPGYHDEQLISTMRKMQNLIGKIHDIYQINSLVEKFGIHENGNGIHPYPMQLFIGWRSRDVLKTFFSLPAAMEGFRKAAKDYLRMLTAFRHSGRIQSGHDSSPHEPIQ